MERICQETGRSYTNIKYYVERDHGDVAEEIQHAYGWDEPDINGHEQDAVTRELDPYVQWRIEQAGGDAINASRREAGGGRASSDG